jgi:hypothetical protein
VCFVVDEIKEFILYLERVKNEVNRVVALRTKRTTAPKDGVVVEAPTEK